mmetsp:Transcript_46000/g.130084  ORF Transcript_46000/g.130084 Transcript_46000/m.130084 type:complete len:288 (+) Transcript_46000:153-1016(+)
MPGRAGSSAPEGPPLLLVETEEVDRLDEAAPAVVARGVGGRHLFVEGDGRLDAEVGVEGVPLREEEVEFVVLVPLQTEAVEVDAVLKSHVCAAEVDDQLVVDEDPEVVIPAEQERLSSVVLEEVVHLQGEEVVVVRAGVRDLVVPALSIDGEVVWQVGLELPRGILGQFEHLRDPLVDGRVVVVPLLEGLFAVDRGAADVGWLPVRPECPLHHALVEPCVTPLEVRVALLEVSEYDRDLHLVGARASQHDDSVGPQRHQGRPRPPGVNGEGRPDRKAEDERGDPPLG